MIRDTEIQGKEIRYEDHNGRKMFVTKLNGLKEFEKRMLSESGCPYFLRMQFIQYEDEEWAYYDFTDCVPLTEYFLLLKQAADSAEDQGRAANLILDLIGGILQCLKNIEKYLIFPDDVSIDPEVIFVDTESKRTILAYFKNPFPEHSMQKRIIDSIDRIAECFQTDESKQFVSYLTNQIKEKNPGLDGLIGLIDAMKRENFYIYWKPDNFRIQGTDHSIKNDQKQDGVNRVKRESIIKGIVRNGKIGIGVSVLTGASLLCMIGAYLSGMFEIESIAGLIIIVAGADLMIYRKLVPKAKTRVEK